MDQINPHDAAQDAVSYNTLCALADRYQKLCHIAARAHYLSSAAFANRGKAVGIPASLLAVGVGTTFTKFTDTAFGQSSTPMIAVVSSLAAAITAIQGVLNYSDRSSDHKAAGAKYSAMRRKFEIFKAELQASHWDASRGSPSKHLQELSDELTQLATDSPWFTETKRQMAQIDYLENPETEIGSSIQSSTPLKYGWRCRISLMMRILRGQLMPTNHPTAKHAAATRDKREDV
jgi:hypothetical protein